MTSTSPDLCSPTKTSTKTVCINILPYGSFGAAANLLGAIKEYRHTICNYTYVYNSAFHIAIHNLSLIHITYM